MSRYQKVIPPPPTWMEDLAREHSVHPHQIKAARRTWPDQTITFELVGGQELTMDLPDAHRMSPPDIGEWGPDE